MQHDYLTYSEVSRLLNIKIGTLYSLVSKRQIPHIRLGHRTVRFSKSEILRWIERSQVSTISSEEMSQYCE